MLRNTARFARSFSGGGGYIGILKQLEHSPEGLGAMLKIIYIPDGVKQHQHAKLPSKILRASPKRQSVRKYVPCHTGPINNYGS